MHLRARESLFNKALEEMRADVTGAVRTGVVTDIDNEPGVVARSGVGAGGKACHQRHYE
jgi:hypothetical protein